MNDDLLDDDWPLSGGLGRGLGGINPASGLQMVGCFDVAGNAFGAGSLAADFGSACGSTYDTYAGGCGGAPALCQDAGFGDPFGDW